MTTPRTRVLASVALAPLLFLGGACGSIVDDAQMEDFFSRLGTVSMTVYPAFVKRGADDSVYAPEVADQLAAFLRDESLAQVVVSTEEVPLAGDWQWNQAAMWKASAQSFAKYVVVHPIDTEFALMAEYLMAGDKADGVHSYVVSASGDVIWGCHLNSHSDVFSDIDPRTPSDCTRVLLAFLRKDWLSAR